VTRAREAANDQLDGARQRAEWIYVVAVIGLSAPLYASWIADAVLWGAGVLGYL
jgi:hypothetical protein